MSIAAAADYGRMYGSGSASSMRTLGRGAWAIGTSVWAPLARRTASYWPHAGGARAPSRPEAQQRPSAHASLRPMDAEHVPRGWDRPCTCGCECHGRGGGRQRSQETLAVGRSMGPIVGRCEGGQRSA